MSVEPKIGLVIRYDFLWKNEESAGQQEGGKDRPCVVITMSKAQEDGSRQIAVAPITHSPINAQKGETGFKIPPKMARHLELDEDQSYLKTHEFNTFRWDKGRIPFGVTPASKDRFAFGELHNTLTKKAYDQARENRERGQLKGVDREKLDARSQALLKRYEKLKPLQNRSSSKERDTDRER